MRRAPIVLTATVAGVAAVLSFQPREPTLATATAQSAPPTGGAGSPSTPAAPAAPANPATPADPAAPAAPQASTGAKSADGDAISTRYGNAQVRVTVTDGKITEVQALQLQGNEPKSVQISGAAAPLLRESALQKQTAAIDAVSGATITSASYEASLQSALDKLGFESADGSRGSSEIPQVEEDHGGPPGGGFFPGG